MFTSRSSEIYWLVWCSWGGSRRWMQQDPFLPAFPMEMTAAGVRRKSCTQGVHLQRSWTYQTGCRCTGGSPLYLPDSVKGMQRGCLPGNFQDHRIFLVTERFGSWGSTGGCGGHQPQSCAKRIFLAFVLDQHRNTMRHQGCVLRDGEERPRLRGVVDSHWALFLRYEQMSGVLWQQRLCAGRGTAATQGG